MAEKLVAAAERAPVSRDEAKRHLRINHSEDDFYLDSLILTATSHAESWTRRAFITQSWSYCPELSEWWSLRTGIRLPRSPLQSITAFRYYNDRGLLTIWDAGNYEADLISTPGAVYVRDGDTWPEVEDRRNLPVEIEYIAGYGDRPDDVPFPIRHAILMLIGHWYANREIVAIGTIVSDIPLTVDHLLAPHRNFSFV